MTTLTKEEVYKFLGDLDAKEDYVSDIACEVATAQGAKLDNASYAQVHFPSTAEEGDNYIHVVHATVYDSKGNDIPVEFPLSYLWAKNWKEDARLEAEKRDKEQEGWDEDRQDKWEQFMDLIDYFPNDLVRIWKHKRGL